MALSAHFSHSTPVFHGRKLPEEGAIVGYGAIIHRLKLAMPMPARIALICNQNKKYQLNEWMIFPKVYHPIDRTELSEIECLYNHLVFALKYEGVNLLFFSMIIKHYTTKDLTILVNIEPTGQYSRRIWFLIEWISGKELPNKKNLTKKSYIPLLDQNLQYSIDGEKSSRHLIINNLPGTRDFCPLIYKTKKLENHTSTNYFDLRNNFLNDINKDILQRTTAFLLLQDSKASFTIEGESPKNKRAARWGKVIGQAGARDINKEEILRLQQVVIESSRFITMGFRVKGGFVGEYDRTTNEPIPAHISARWQDIERLMDGLIATNHILIESNFDAVLAAAEVAFGFVFIHPLEDGNGRLHRYMIHHMLAKKQFTGQGIIFPISASILNHIDDYRKVLENYSNPLLEFIEWKATTDHNIEVQNETLDYYRYFDATRQAEFLYNCVKDTIDNIIPTELNYLQNYDAFKSFIDNEFEMPDKMVSLLVRFLEQNGGQLSKRAREKEFININDLEVQIIESKYKEIFI